MRFAVRSKAVADVNDVKTGLIKSRRIVFTPSVALKEELANTSIQITCYDRDGTVVKRVTSDAGEIEDPDDTDDNGTGGGTTNSGNDNENQNQGGSQQGGGTTNSGNDNENENENPGGGDNNSGGFDEG